MKKEEREIFEKYIYQIVMSPTSGEEAVCKLMPMPILAHTPIFNEIKKLEASGIKVAFAYGDMDWVDTDMNDICVSRQLEQAGHKVYILDNSKHQMYLDNPEELADIVNDFVLDI